VKFFNHVQFPDEFFFQTLVMNSEYSDTIINDNLRYIDFSDRKAHPGLLTTRDLNKLLTTEKLFARKFDTDIDSGVLDYIDGKILIKAHS